MFATMGSVIFPLGFLSHRLWCLNWGSKDFPKNFTFSYSWISPVMFMSSEGFRESVDGERQFVNYSFFSFCAIYIHWKCSQVEFYIWWTIFYHFLLAKRVHSDRKLFLLTWSIFKLLHTSNDGICFPKRSDIWVHE